MINWIKSKSISLLTIVFIALVSGILVFSVLLKEKGNYKVIASDGIGYYSYLPNTFNNYSLDNQTPDNRFFNEVKDKVKAITPVPGGVGPMTIACLLKNTLECFKDR